MEYKKDVESIKIVKDILYSTLEPATKVDGVLDLYMYDNRIIKLKLNSKTTDGLTSAGFKQIIDTEMINSKKIKGKLRLELPDNRLITLNINCSRKRGEHRK